MAIQLPFARVKGASGLAPSLTMSHPCQTCHIRRRYKLKVVTGNSNVPLAEAVAKRLGVELTATRGIPFLLEISEPTYPPPPPPLCV